ncbi:DUF551 domain-containing protein [Butyricicoccus intestinisimiae]|uniref:DUF551 domain-containing protein n=1 Tax=Butyricicoccus intestinisimiae TaxID=2841509 RepID=A0ABS6EQH6_9FIRM|nr:DUF551 domain-containing protein [Butyricicoccus intestinisimiae]MBU5489114.1 DUF551 domain-containing protein [Butyricicoccus intestinisimiae]
MKTTEAIGYIDKIICDQERYEEWALEEKSEDEELLHEIECELEALRMAVQALKEKPRWIPCAERLPEMHEEVDYTGRQEESDFVLVCDASELHPQVHVGRCVKIEDRTWWRTREWKVLDKVTAWMPLPKAYEEER